jgi:hypothetical protein
MNGFGNVAEIEKCRVDVLEGNAGFGGAAGLGYAGDTAHVHGIGRFFPEGAFFTVVFLGEVESVV